MSQNASFDKLVTLDTSVASLVVGGATANATTGTGGINAGTVTGNTQVVGDTGTLAGQMPATGAKTIKAIHQMTGTTDSLAAFFAVKSAIDGANVFGDQTYAYSTLSGAATQSNAIGGLSTAEHAGAGTITSLRGHNAELMVTSTGGGTDATCYNAAPTLRTAGGAGTYTNAYGFKVGTFGAGATNKYSLFSSDATAVLSHAGDIYLAATKKFYFDGGSNTYLSEISGDNLNVVSGGSEVGRFYTAGLLLNTTAGIINDAAKLAIKFSGVNQAGVRVQTSTDTGGDLFLQFINSSSTPQGSIDATNSTTTAFNTSSDMRLKVDHGVFTDTDGLAQLVIHDAEWIENGHRAPMLFAQEAILAAPEAVKVGGDNPQTQPWMVDYSKLVPRLIAGWHAHEARINDLEQRLIQAGV